MKYEVRRGNKEDAKGVVDLFSEDGNPHNWSLEKWSRYYESYTEGEPVIFVAEIDGKIIGHYSLFPILIGKYHTYLGAHAYISSKLRGLAVLSSLMKSLDEFCKNENIPFIVGFANPRFTIIKNKLFKWNTPFYLSFMETDKFEPNKYNNRPYLFNYSSDWFKWRFNKPKPPFISKYTKLSQKKDVYQLLYTTELIEAKNHDITSFEVWCPKRSIKQPNEDFSQPFSIKVYDKYWNGPDLLDPNNWFIQMADSDTFIFKDYNNE